MEPHWHRLHEERILFRRILYKTKNQHSASAYYQHLRHVDRLLRRMDRIGQMVEVVERQEQVEEMHDEPLPLPLPPTGQQALELFALLETALGKAYASIRALVALRYFLPFGLVTMAVLARMSMDVVAIAKCWRIAEERRGATMNVAAGSKGIDMADDDEDLGGKRSIDGRWEDG